MICKICNKYCKSVRGLSTHLQYHNISLINYKIEYDNFIIPKCACGKDVKINNRTCKTCGDSACITKLHKNRTHSDVTKNKIRIKRVEYLKVRRGNSAWENRWNNKLSYLESWFYDNIIVKYNLHSKYDIVNEYPFYPYFIDFAFLNIKLAVELDGACHFNNGEPRKQHDIKRDDFLIENGWKVFRISYKEINTETINKFINILNDIYNSDKILDNIVYRGKISYFNTKKRRNRKEYCEQIKLNNEQKQKQYIDIVLNSNINFSKFGWVTETSKIINQKPQKVNAWMLRFMKDFYDSNCFKRK